MQVQQLVLGTFLDRAWRSAYLSTVPAAFVADTLLPAAHAWVSHKGARLWNDGRFVLVLLPPKAARRWTPE